MIKTYKYYIFYKRSDGDIYAYTDNKEYYKKFKEQRNMKNFIYKKKELTGEQVSELAREYNNGILENCSLKYSDNGKISHIKMIITKMEKFAVMNESSDLLSCEIYQYTWISPEIFNDEIIKSLEVLNYTKCHNLLSKGNFYFEVFTEADELGIFLRQFSDTI